MEEYYSRKEVAEMLGVTIGTIDRWMAEGAISYSRFNGTIRFKASDIQKIEERQEVTE